MKIRNREIVTLTFDEIASFTEVITTLEEITANTKYDKELSEYAFSLADDLSEFLNHYTEAD